MSERERERKKLLPAERRVEEVKQKKVWKDHESVQQ